MILLALYFPALILTITKTWGQSWRVVRLFGTYIVLFSIFQFIVNYFQIGNFWLIVLYLFLGFMEVSNLEHVINNNANQNFIFIKFLFDPTFLKGSGITKRFFIRLAFISISLVLISFLRISILPWQNASFLLIGSLITFFIPQSSILPGWSQENWVFFNLKNLIWLNKQTTPKLHKREDVSFSKEKLHAADEKYKSFRPLELGKGKWLNQTQKRNVLLIVIEGLGEIHFKNGWLPKLSKRRAENIRSQTFINHQRNTNRGMYSLYTGKHPNLMNQMAKPDLVAQYGKMDTGVASVLVENGYQTVFLQGAPTKFMCKDRFMPELGFQEVIGEEHFPQVVPRIKWGVDDNQLYKQAEVKIQELQDSAHPWFLSLLTVATHHPIQASNKILKNLEDGFRYADEELDYFLEKLIQHGVLENTVVFITSDESAGDSSHILSESLGSMTILTPEKHCLALETPFCQSDVAFSLCDYLDIVEHPFLGRSLFRYYDLDRPLYFASIFQQKVFLYENQKLYIQHYAGKREIFELASLSLNSKVIPIQENVSSKFRHLNDFLQASDRGLDYLTTPVILDIKEILPTGEDVVKSPGFIKVGLKKGETIRLTFNAKNNHQEMPVVVNWLIQDMKFKRSFKPNIIILPGTLEAFEKVFISPDDSWYDLSIRVMANGNEQWKVEELQIFK